MRLGNFYQFLEEAKIFPVDVGNHRLGEAVEHDQKFQKVFDALLKLLLLEFLLFILLFVISDAALTFEHFEALLQALVDWSDLSLLPLFDEDGDDVPDVLLCRVEIFSIAFDGHLLDELPLHEAA